MRNDGWKMRTGMSDGKIHKKSMKSGYQRLSLFLSSVHTLVVQIFFFIICNVTILHPFQAAAMGFLKREEKPLEKVKVAKASLPFHATDTNATCFKCGKAGHLRKDCKDGKTTTSQSGGFYSGCGVKRHNEAKYWKLHPELKPVGNKGTKAGGNEKDKEAKAFTGEKKGWKAKFAELEAKMAAMSATTSGGAKPQVTPSFHAGGGFGPDDEEYGDFMMSGMAFTAEDLTLEVFANTQSQTAAPKDTPRGASSNLDPQRGEGNRQA
jgi:hypothetical protein